MIETKTLITSAKLESSDLLSLLIAMSEEGWKPAILESEKYFLQLARVEGELDIQSLRQPLDTFYRGFQ